MQIVIDQPKEHSKQLSENIVKKTDEIMKDFDWIKQLVESTPNDQKASESVELQNSAQKQIKPTDRIEFDDAVSW